MIMCGFIQCILKRPYTSQTLSISLSVAIAVYELGIILKLLKSTWTLYLAVPIAKAKPLYTLIRANQEQMESYRVPTGRLSIYKNFVSMLLISRYITHILANYSCNFRFLSI